MTVASLVGYALLFGLAMAFFILGIKGFSAAGLPLSRRTNLNGRPGQSVGAVLALFGATILAAGIWDICETQFKRQTKHEPRQVEPAPGPREAEKKQVAEVPRVRLINRYGFYYDIYDKWTHNLRTSGGWFYRHPEGLVMFGSEQSDGLLPGFYITWGGGTLEDLPEPNAPFGLQIAIVRDADDALKSVRRFENLKALGLSFATLSNEGLENLKENRKLEWLFLYGAKSKDDDFSAIGGCTSLVQLGLGSTNVTDTSLKKFAKLQNLEELVLYITPMSDAGLEDIGKLHNLKVLNLALTKITDNGLIHLGGLKQLRKLDLGGTAITDAGLKHLHALEGLEELKLVQTKISDKSIGDLAQLKRLKTVHLLFTNISDQGVAELKKKKPDLKLPLRAEMK